MVKGFIFFREEKIPFVISDYRMEIFTDDSLLNDFVKEHNFQFKYILKGQCFRNGFQGQDATFLIEHSVGSTCYLFCYIINSLTAEDGYDTIGLQSPFLDDIFRYKYNYLDMVRTGANLAMTPKEVYKIPFFMNCMQYELSFCVGHDHRLGLLKDFDKKGEVFISLKTAEIQECYDISTVLHRLAMFMTSHADTPFKKITLYKNGWISGFFYCPLVSEKAVSGYDALYCEFDVMKYIPKILNNIALDSGKRL